MKLSPTRNQRFNEPVGFLFLLAAIASLLSLVSYHPLDPSLNVASAAAPARNLVGSPGAWFSDSALQWLGLGAFLLPLYITMVGWKWVRSDDLEAPLARTLGWVLLSAVSCAGLALTADLQLWGGAVEPGGVLGSILAEELVAELNRPGAVLALCAMFIAALYLVTSFELAAAVAWLARLPTPWSFAQSRWRAWRAARAERKERRRQRNAHRRDSSYIQTLQLPEAALAGEEQEERAGRGDDGEPPPIVPYAELADDEGAQEIPISEREGPPEMRPDEEPPWEEADEELDEEGEEEEEITYRIPPTSLLSPPYERTTYDREELHALARQIVAKFQEFKVGGTVTQINPGPVVTTFEFKPDPGVKYSKIINLSEDLCLALECESILVERIPGKSTVGIEVPNRKREIIALREVVESRPFRESDSPLTVAMGKDISGQIRVADLTAMPHLLMAGSTGSGKSVMINTFVMSILLRSTPNEVRVIMVDPKTVELGLYREIPHLLTPVITDMKKASNALKNATAEMERRLKLLAEHGVRNIDQFNRKMERMRGKLEKEGNEDLAGELKDLPYILIIIDELADLMMLEGRQIEESITRLAQMARAVGIHLLLATQRPSVDVITGLIKANIPSRISFRLTSRIDSRTILDTMGAEALLGKGDMLFLPPGTQRLMRLHAPLVTEEEIEAVVREWKVQAKPRYETEYLKPPADEIDSDAEDAPGFSDPMFSEAVRVVLDMGKASTSTLQRRLRIGYGRAASILDAMEKDGIVGPQDGSRPREVLKRPDWLDEVAQ